MRIGVVIPFFQREGGILRRALDSVAAQDPPEGATIKVVVVDDASPVQVDMELAGLAMPAWMTVTILAQPNGGPGAARNHGLDHLAGTVDYVAFLDSDDSWKAHHLTEAVAGLRSGGYDFYFCQNRRTGSEEADPDGSERELQQLMRLGEQGVTHLPGQHQLIVVESDRLLSAYLNAYLSQTSTVVMSSALADTRRFDPRLRNAGEDHMFWIDVALSGTQAVMSLARNVECGFGVNIYHSAYDFSSIKVVERVGYLMLFWSYVGAKLGQHPYADRPRAKVHRYRRAFSYLFLRAIVRGQLPAASLLWRLAREDPLLIPAMPFRFLSVLPRRASEALTW